MQFPVRAPGHNVPLIRFDFGAIYVVCQFSLYSMLPHLSFFLHFFLTYLLSYLSFPSRIDPLHFQARQMSQKATKSGFIFCVYFVV